MEEKSGERHLQRFLLRLRAVLARNLTLEDPFKRPRRKIGLPDTKFRILGVDPESQASEVLYESLVCPNTLNPSWIVLDLNHHVLQKKWRRVRSFTVEIVEQALKDAGEDEGPLRATAALTAPAESAYAFPDYFGKQRSEEEGEETADKEASTVRIEVNLADLSPLGCGIADLPSLPPNALLFSMRLDSSLESKSRDTEALFAPKKLCEALKQFGLIQPPQSFQSSSMAAAVLEECTARPKDGEGEGEQSEEARLSDLADDLREKQEQVKTLRAEVAELLAPAMDSNAASENAHIMAEKRVERLRAQVAAAQASLKSEEDLLAAEEAALRSDTAELRELMQRIGQENANLERLEEDVDAAESAYMRTSFLLEARQTRLLSELQSIYPLQLMPNKEWAIRGLELPRDLSGKDDEHISSALGYVAHLVLMLSKYLAVPLRYQILYYSSRSAIRDEVRDGANASTTYYLFRRGVERERFEFAVMMLQKNVEQLLAARHVPYDSNLSMLPNLHNLFVHEMDPRAA